MDRQGGPSEVLRPKLLRDVGRPRDRVANTAGSVAGVVGIHPANAVGDDIEARVLVASRQRPDPWKVSGLHE